MDNLIVNEHFTTQKTVVYFGCSCFHGQACLKMRTLIRIILPIFLFVYYRMPSPSRSDHRRKIERPAILTFFFPAGAAGGGWTRTIDIEGAKIDCLSLFMCSLLAQHIMGFFSFFAVAIYSTNEENMCR